MPYQNYFPASYQQMYPQVQPQIQMPQLQTQAQLQPQMQSAQQAQTQSQQTQNAYIGLVPTPSEQYARDFPVALNSSVTFINENAPYIYSKTMGASQLVPPKFEKYRLVKEEDEKSNVLVQEEGHDPQVEYVTKSEFEKIQSEIRNLKASIKGLSKVQAKGVRNESGNE